MQSSLSAQAASAPVPPITSALRERDFDKALQLLQPALNSSPRNAQLWMFQGLAFSGKGDSKSALTSYQHALSISPDYLPALEGAAQIEYDAGKPDAIPLLEHVLKIRPDNVTSHAMLAVLAARNNKCETAVEHFPQSGPLLDSQPDALQAYGVCLLKLKRSDDAVRVFQQLAASRPDDVRCRRRLAAVQLAAERPQDALATLQPLLDANSDVSTMRLAAAIYEANKDTPNAVKILREAIVKDPRKSVSMSTLRRSR